MEINRFIYIISFSSTGNTDWIIASMIPAFKDNGITVRCFNYKEEYFHEKNHEVILAFSANSQAASPYNVKYVKCMTQGLNDSLYLLLTYNESAYILEPFIKLLIKKSYSVKGAKAISMPNNFLLKKNLNGTENRLNKAKEKALIYANQIVTEKQLLSLKRKVQNVRTV